MQPIMYECVRCEGGYFETADLIKSHVREKHGMSAVNREINEKCCNVPGTNFLEQEGDCHLDSVSKDLITIHYSDLTIEEVSGFSMHSDGESSDRVEITEVLPSPADDAISCCSDTSTSYDITESTHSIATEVASINNGALCSRDDLTGEGENSPYRCTDCGKVQGYSLQILNTHVGKYKGCCKQLFSGNTFYSCEICQKDYSRLDTLKRHNKKFGNSCKNWQISFNDKTVAADIPQRIQTESGTEKNYYPVSSSNHLIADGDSEPYYCPDCGRCLGYSIVNYKSHITRFRGSCKKKFIGKTLYTCEHCKQEFATLSNLKTHHSLNGDLCKRKQTSLNQNQIMSNFHREVRETLKHDATSPAGAPLTNKKKRPRYTCSICGKGMGHSFVNLKRHITRYQGHCRKVFSLEKSHSCKYCGADFSSVYLLKRHNRLLGERCKP